jgi:hypothetical protein
MTPTERMAIRWFPPVIRDTVPKMTGPITAAVFPQSE